MSDAPPEQPCRNCGDARPSSELDAFGWCPRCRRVVIERATLTARLVAAVVLAVLAYLVFAVIDPGPRFLILWLVGIVAVYAIVYKVIQRVAFEAFRARGVTPPER